jgi:hypothetical protein
LVNAAAMQDVYEWNSTTYALQSWLRIAWDHAYMILYP